MKERDFLKLQYERLSVLNMTPKEQNAVDGWIDAIGDIRREVGEVRLRTAVELCLREMQYFPTPKQLRDMVPTTVSDEMRKGRTCVKCNRIPFGFVWVDSPPGSGRWCLGRCDHIVDANSVPAPADPPKSSSVPHSSRRKDAA